MFAYPLEFTCSLPDNKRQLSNAHLYLREGQIYIVPDFERLTGELLSRNRETVVRVTVPAGALKPGHYDVTLIGEHTSKAWSVVVK